MLVGLGVFSQECGYCKGAGVSHYYGIDRVDDDADDVYADFIETHGGRRCGALFYTPCMQRSCCPLYSLRVPTSALSVSKSQRKAVSRAMRHVCSIEIVAASELSRDLLQREFAIYLRYQAVIHGDSKATMRSFGEFLVASPVNTLHQLYWSNGQLVAVGVLDCLVNRYVSSVYFFYDPDYWRGKSCSIGTAAAILEMQWARDNSYSYYTLGLYSSTCPKLAYKARFGPSERFALTNGCSGCHDTGHWLPINPAG